MNSNFGRIHFLFFLFDMVVLILNEILRDLYRKLLFVLILLIKILKDLFAVFVHFFLY